MSHWWWRLAPALALCFCLGAAAQTAADCPPDAPDEASAPAPDGRNRGLLWRATRNGRASYLYATLHLGQASWRLPGPAVQEALRESDVLAIELDISDPEVLREWMLAMAEPSRQPPELPAPLRERLAALSRLACVNEDAIAGTHPLMQAMTLSVLESRREQLHPVYGVELALKQLAVANAQAVLSMETPAQQLAAMLPAPGEDMLPGLERTLRQLEQGRARALVRRLTDAWERGDLNTLNTYARWCECVVDAQDRRTMARLIDQRNLRLAARIEQLHRQPLKVFAAVGALHMTGPQALPQLLRQRGFRVERVPLPP